MASKQDQNSAISTDHAMVGLLAVAVADREDRFADDKAKPRRTETVLADAGLPLTVIARLTGKNYETVKTIVRRGRATVTAAAAEGTSTGGSQDASA